MCFFLPLCRGLTLRVFFVRLRQCIDQLSTLQSHQSPTIEELTCLTVSQRMNIAAAGVYHTVLVLRCCWEKALCTVLYLSPPLSPYMYTSTGVSWFHRSFLHQAFLLGDYFHPFAASAHMIMVFDIRHGSILGAIREHEGVCRASCHHPLIHHASPQ